VGAVDVIPIGEKDARNINNASLERGEEIIVTACTIIHKSCLKRYVNKKDITTCVMQGSENNQTKCSRVLFGSFDNKSDYLFCRTTGVKIDSK